MALIGADQVLRFVSGSGSDLLSGQSSTRGVGEACELHVDWKQEKFLSPPPTPKRHYSTTGIVSNLSLAITIPCAARGENKIL